MSTTISREQISAVFDGEWIDAGGDAAACAAVRAVASDPQAQGDWLVYAQIGDCLRTPDLRLLPREEDFLARINAAIAQEPVVIAPRAVQAAQVAGAAHRRPHWSTRIAAGMAAVAGVAVMAWVALPTLQEGNTTGGQVATGPGTGAAPQVAALQPGIQRANSAATA